MTVATHHPLPVAKFAPFPGRRRSAGVGLLAVALAACLAAPALGEASEKSAAPSTAGAITWQDHRFEPQSGDPVDAELGVLTVPEHRRSAESRPIELRFVRFKSTSKTPGSPIVYLAGGPGGSGISTAQGRRFPLFMALRAHADVIALDQRGTGLSNDIPRCEFPERAPLDRPSERAWVGGYLERQARHCAQFWAQSGVDLNGYNTAESADDLEDLRRALGVPTLSLWGISYGTHLAFAALDRHPKSFDRAILASAEGPDHTIKRPARTDQLLATFDARLEGDWVADLRSVLDGLRREPAVTTTTLPGLGEVKVAIGAFDLQLIMSFMVSDPGRLAQLVEWTPAWVARDFSEIGPIVAGLRARLGSLDGMSIAMDAASGTSEGRLKIIRDERTRAVLGDALNFPMLPDWPVAEWLGIKTLPDAFRRAPRSAVPALFLSGSLDGRTYTQSHRELAAGFGNATFIVIEGAGHNLFMASPEVESRILQFLDGGKTSDESIPVPSFLDR
ncbi:MAG: alpha/beta fold hydrolase [Acidobacteriota bacterium]